MAKRTQLTYTLTFVQGHGEPQEVFLERIQKVVDYARQLNPHDAEPLSISPDDTKFKQVGPTSYEIITPGYENGEEIAKS